MTTGLPAKPIQGLQHFGQSLEPQARLKHRLWIGIRVEALLDGYWDKMPSEAVKEEITRDWIDCLDAFTQAEVQTACREWVRDNPRRKPNFGDIRALIMAERAKLVPPKSEPEPYTAIAVPVDERRASSLRIMSEVFGK